MRKISGLMLMMFLAVFLAACGDEAEDAEPTEAATGDTAVTETTDTETATETETDTATETETETAGEVADEATPSDVMEEIPEVSPVASPVGTPAASPVTGMEGATPVATPVGGATPVGADATPVSDMTDATPEAATPAASSITPATASPDAAEEEPADMVMLNGKVELMGEENVAYVLSNDGCAGLGANRDLRDGRQVLVRDESGTLVGVGELATSADADGCSWDFSVEVPESTFYEVSIPMKTVMAFSHDEVEASNGEVSLQLP